MTTTGICLIYELLSKKRFIHIFI